jgi:hypothetical protein
VKSSVVWSPDFTKVIWYNADNDAIICNGLNPNVSKYKCSINRINEPYKQGDLVVYNNNIWKIISLGYYEGKYILEKYNDPMRLKTGIPSFSDIKPYDINYILSKEGFNTLFSDSLLKDTVDKNTQILRELKPIPNIRSSIEEVEMKEAD